MFEKYKEYALDVINGVIPAGELVRLQCERYLSWFDRDDIEFRPDKADKPVKFISHLRHTDGDFENKPFELLPWQKFLMYGMFGWYYKGTEDRVIKKSFIEISRKNGKTSLCSALSLYGLVADGESGAEIDYAAPSREQAMLAFRYTTNYAKSVRGGERIFRCLRNTITCDALKSRIRIMSPEAKLGDGFNPHFGIVDEYHAFKEDRISEVLQSGMGMRRNPMMIYITTAGFDLSGPCKQYRDMCENILRGVKFDDSIFALIYELDKDDDWCDESVWAKCCPSLGETVRWDYMREQVTLAKNNNSMQVGVKTKNMNMWVQSAMVWIKDMVLHACSKRLDINDFTGCYCSVGIDLASVSDLAAVTALISNGDGLYAFTWTFIPETTYNDCPNTLLYRRFRTSDPEHFIITPGNVTDYDFILAKLLDINKICPIQAVYYDSWNSSQFTISATDAGFNMVPYSQSIGAYNRPTKEFERLVLSDRIVIDYSECVLWAFQNCALKYDNNENCKPVKGGGRNQKIDPVISMLTALGGMLQDPQYSNEIWVV